MHGLAGPPRVPVGAALAVNRTRDGGRSLQALRHRLPEQDCHDLVYRHGLAVAVDGRWLLMGSNNGHLRASDDAGEHGQAVLMHLPPDPRGAAGLDVPPQGDAAERGVAAPSTRPAAASAAWPVCRCNPCQQTLGGVRNRGRGRGRPACGAEPTPGPHDRGISTQCGMFSWASAANNFRPGADARRAALLQAQRPGRETSP